MDEQGHFYKPVQVTSACIDCACQTYLFVTFVAAKVAPPDPLRAKSAMATGSYNAALETTPAKVGGSSNLVRCNPCAR